MFRLDCVEFVLPGYDEVADGGEDHPPVAVSNTEATVPIDYTDNDGANIEALTKAIKSIPQEQRVLVEKMVEDVRDGNCKLEFNERTGKVILKDFSDTSRLQIRTPEHTLKMVNAANKSDVDKDFEIREICGWVDQMKLRRISSGVALNNKMGISSFKSYEEGQQYISLGDTLGEGLNATVKVIKDMKTEEHLAQKSIFVHRFNSNEVRAMYDLRNAAICPDLCGIQFDRRIVTIYMEIVKNCITVENAIKQLAGSKSPTFSIGLFVLIELMKALDVMHNDYRWYHQDLHSGNVYIEKVSSDEQPWRIRIIDFGNAKSLSDLKELKPENYLQALSFDLQNILMQFFAMALCGQEFKDYKDFDNIKDFKDNYESTLDQCQESDFSKELVKEIIRKGLAVRFQQEKEFIKFLKSKLDTVSTKDITTLFEFLSLDRVENPEPVSFADIHSKRV